MLRHPEPPPANPWLIRLLTLLLAALAAASATYWALKWPGREPSLTSAPPLTDTPPIDPEAVARLLGARPGPASTESRAVVAQNNLKLLGVIAQGGAGSRGSALIAIEGGATKPYRIGQTVQDGLVLHSVKARSAYLAPDLQSAATAKLELPPLVKLP
jgi:general secretion pathway protein C